MSRLAVVLMNLGGPDRLESVQPFLFNLFNDPAIIGLPQPLRWIVAQAISRRRAPIARRIYEELGGRSPLLQNTAEQAEALAEDIRRRSGFEEVRCFIAMRYWHPLTEEAVELVRQWRPDRVLLLPLYPQYSTTTTASSVRRWRRIAKRKGLRAETRTICCYPALDGLVAATAKAVCDGLRAADGGGIPRVLFSAHGLPAKVVARGDPYKVQVEYTAAAVVAALQGESFDWTICYQSRVGPLEWIRPYTEDEIRRAGADGVPVVVVPIAFVSEHSETLVELDIEYRKLASSAGVTGYWRTPTVGADGAFIASLGALAAEAAAGAASLCSGRGARLCPADRTQCAFAAAP
ncbi:MAG: ferrochelatase [Alphaproteobacteria bacterium]|nr:ferrochelatase [Alphaproteobacteria bacterium]